MKKILSGFICGSICCLFIFSSTIISAQDETEEEQQEESVIEVAPIRVEAEELRTTPGQTEYSSQLIRDTPTGEGNLSDLLRLNPAVDFSRNSELSAGTATLRPAEISIHNQLFYQNLFLIDGTDTNNDINPASSQDLWRTPSLTQPLSGSSPQGYYVDVSLLEKIEVLDSNISVEHGGFMGGVVSADVKTYKDGNRISWNIGLQRDEWEKFHITEEDINSADKYSAVYTPDYDKKNFSVSVERALTDNLGLTLGISQRNSTFAQEYEDDADILRMIHYDDSISNVIGKLSTELANSKLGVSFRFTNREHDGLTSTNYTGAFVKSHEGRGITVDWERPVSAGEFSLTASVDSVVDSLDSEGSYFSYHEYLENSGESRYEGAFGDVNQQQTRMSIKPRWTLDPKEIGGRTHAIKYGADLRATNSFYERPEDVVFEQYYCVRDDGRNGCRDQDDSGGSSAGDEFLNRRSFYYAGKVDISYREVSGYIEDQIDFNQIRVSLGLRGDWGSYLENFDISPRVSATWRPSNAEDRKLTVGLNRYYGRSFLRYELNDAISGWREFYSNLTRPRGRDTEEVPCSIPDFTNCTHLTFDNNSGSSSLDSPYSDEWMIGWSQPLGKFSMGAQYVNRASRDGVSRRRDDDGRYFYSNEGRSDTQSVTLDLTNDTPFLIGPTSTQFMLALSYRDTESNRQDEDGYDEQLETDLIYYKGSLISADALPAWDYNIPVGIRLQSVTVIEKINITWTNFYNYRQGGTIARDSREDYASPDTGIEYDIYEDFDFDSLFTINSQIKWTQSISDRTELFVRFEIHNLFDQTMDSSTVSTRRRFTSGRRFWLEFGSTFF